MSDEDSSSSNGFFKRHAKKVWATIIISVLVSTVAGLAYFNFIPDLGFLFSPILLVVYGILGFLLLIAFVVKISDRSVGFPGISHQQQVENQLSKYEAQALVKRMLYESGEEEEPIIPGKTLERHGKPVKNDQEGSSNRVFTWKFRERTSGEVMCAFMSLEQEMDFNPEWVQPPLDLEELEMAHEKMREVNSFEWIRMRDKEDLESFDDRVEEKRQEIGESVMNQDVIEYYDEEGNISKREKKSVTRVPEEQLEG